MAMKCSSCGGTLVFDIAEKRLKCNYCDSLFDVENYNVSNEGNVSSQSVDDIKVDTYLCKNCGAELSAPEEQLVSYCMYCGGEATLMHKSDSINKPTGIIPFKCTKEHVQQEYAHKLKGYLFVPRELKNPKFIEGFRGIYIPYWKTQVSMQTENILLKGEKFSTEGSYDYRRYYDCTVHVEGTFDGGSYDASAAFDDTIAEEIAPFYESDIVPFKEGYLAGFYADKATVPSEIYDSKIEENINIKIKRDISAVTDGINTDEKDVTEKIKWKKDKTESVLFPVWFLTWRNKNRVAYSVMNGETGAMSCDIPVDFKKFFLAAFVLTLVIFGILSALPIFLIPVKTAAFSSCLMFLSGVLLKKELRKIRIKETHEEDLGYMQYQGKSLKDKKKGCMSAFKGLFTFILYAIFLYLIQSAFSVTTTDGLASLFVSMIIFQAGLAISQMMQLRGIKNKGAVFPALLAVIVQAAGFVVSSSSVQHDFWYYGIAFGCLIGMIINCIACIMYINNLATRAVPNFYTREGANNGR